MQFATVYVEINIFCIIIIWIITGFFRRSVQKVSISFFIQLAVAMIVFIASDCLWYLCDQDVIAKNRIVSYILKSLYFLGCTYVCYFAFEYFETDRESMLADTIGKRLAFAVPTLLHVILMVVNVKTGIFFTIDENVVYDRGPFFALQYVFDYLYIGAATYRGIAALLKDKSYIDRDRVAEFAFLPFFPGAAGVIQYFHWRLPVLAPAGTIALMVIVLATIELSVTIDPLTQIMNRKKFLSTLSRKMKVDNEGRLYLFMIDVDYFKTINDTYGHVEGDRALVRVGKALREACEAFGKSAVPARYGGDEFAILFESDATDAKTMMIQAIEESMNLENVTFASGYELKLSVGGIVYNSGIHTVREFFNLADTELYVVKNKRHRDGALR